MLFAYSLSSKIMSTVTSLFTSSYVFEWPNYMEDTKLLYPPSFDGRIVLYPTDKNLRDYLAWRQVDCKLIAFSFFPSLWNHLNVLFMPMASQLFLFLPCFLTQPSTFCLAGQFPGLYKCTNFVLLFCFISPYFSTIKNQDQFGHYI